MIITQEFFISEWSKAAIKHDPRTPYQNWYTHATTAGSWNPLQQARIFPAITCALLYSTPQAPLLPKSRSNEFDNGVGTNKLERYTVKRPQTRTHPPVNPQLPQLWLDKLWGAVPYNRKRLPRTLSLVESNPVYVDLKTLSFFGL